MNERQTVAGAYEKIAGHEELCAERYRNIEEKLGDFKGTLNKLVWGVMSILVSVAGWMAVQMWDGVQRDIQTAPPVVVSE